MANGRNVGNDSEIKRINGSIRSAPAGTITIVAAALNNSTTAVPFTLVKGSLITMQPDVAIYFNNGTTSAVTTSSVLGLRLEANEKWVQWLDNDETFIACQAVSGGAAVIKVFLMS